MSWTGDNRNAILNAQLNLDYSGSTDAAVKVVSAYYSGFTTQAKLWLRMPWRIDLAFMAWVWSRQSIYYAETVTETALREIDMEYNSDLPTADHVDVLCTVFWRLGNKQHKMSARRLLLYANKLDEKSAQMHTIAFITLHNVRYGLEKWSESVHGAVLKMAMSITTFAASADAPTKLANYGQASRIFRQLAEMLPVNDKRRADYLSKAQLCAEAGGVTDQILKAK